MDSEILLERRTLTLPLGDNDWALLEASWPMTLPQWERMIHVLDVMQPGLVLDAARVQRDAGEE